MHVGYSRMPGRPRASNPCHERWSASHVARTSPRQYSLSNVNGVVSMLRLRSVLPSMRFSHAAEMRRECAWPSVCAPEMAVRCHSPPQ